MLEADFFGKLLPTHPDITAIIRDIRCEYDIPEISPQDDSLRVFLRHHLDINWKAVHAQILQRLKDLPDLFPESTMKAYRAFKLFEKKGLVDPELKKVSPEFRKGVRTMTEHFFNIYRPTAEKIDGAYSALADHCREFLLTGEARPIPQEWIATVQTLTDKDGQKTVMAMANELANPDQVAEMFKDEFHKAFPHHEFKITEEYVRSADLLRERLFGKPIDYLLDEEEKTDPKRFSGRKSRRYPTSARRHRSRMRQKIGRLKKALFDALT